MIRRESTKAQNKRERIFQAANQLFFENGFDGTSIRNITKKAGCEVGLFYYYYKNKDEVFDEVLERFFDQYHVDFIDIVKRGRRDPFRMMSRFFQYLVGRTQEFRREHADKVHQTVRWAIRERLLSIIVPYLKQMVHILIQQGARPVLNVDVVSMFLAHGVGSIVLHEDVDWVIHIMPEVRKGVNLIMGLPINMAELMFPFFAEETDIPCIVELAQQQKEYFPQYDKEAFEASLAQKIVEKEVVVIRNQGKVAGCVGFSKEHKEIEFLMTFDHYQNRGVGTRLLITAMSEYPVGAEVSVLAFCDSVERGQNARRLYDKFGFFTREMVTDYEYPCERMSVMVPEKV